MKMRTSVSSMKIMQGTHRRGRRLPARVLTRSPGRIAGVPCFASCLRSNLPLRSTGPRMRGDQIPIVDASICVKAFRCKPRPATVALMNSEFRLFILLSQRPVGFALRPRKADSDRVPGDRAARHPRERSTRRRSLPLRSTCCSRTTVHCIGSDLCVLPATRPLTPLPASAARSAAAVGGPMPQSD